MNDPSSAEMFEMDPKELAEIAARGTGSSPGAQRTEARIKTTFEARLLIATLESVESTKRLAKWTTVMAVATFVMAAATVLLAVVAFQDDAEPVPSIQPAEVVPDE